MGGRLTGSAIRDVTRASTVLLVMTTSLVSSTSSKPQRLGIVLRIRTSGQTRKVRKGITLVRVVGNKLNWRY
jgi:hypothetical protein